MNVRVPALSALAYVAMWLITKNNPEGKIVYHLFRINGHWSLKWNDVDFKIADIHKGIVEIQANIKFPGAPIQI